MQRQVLPEPVSVDVVPVGSIKTPGICDSDTFGLSETDSDTNRENIAILGPTGDIRQEQRTAWGIADGSALARRVGQVWPRGQVGPSF